MCSTQMQMRRKRQMLKKLRRESSPPPEATPALRRESSSPPPPEATPAGTYSQMADMYEDLVKFLYCPVCMEMPKTKFTTCRNGHVLCNKCNRCNGKPSRRQSQSTDDQEEEDF